MPKKPIPEVKEPAPKKVPAPSAKGTADCKCCYGQLIIFLIQVEFSKGHLTISVLYCICHYRICLYVSALLFINFCLSVHLKIVQKYTEVRFYL